MLAVPLPCLLLACPALGHPHPPSWQRRACRPCPPASLHARKKRHCHKNSKQRVRACAACSSGVQYGGTCPEPLLAEPGPWRDEAILQEVKQLQQGPVELNIGAGLIPAGSASPQQA